VLRAEASVKLSVVVDRNRPIASTMKVGFGAE